MMQLATSQRPHPPPVPPRPSRQVVAEALKRTPRPPCPTRQAPPPPNTKPWRSEEQETSQGRDGGRTVIYESLKESSNCQEIRAASEPRVINVSSERDGILSRRRSTEEINGRIKDSTKIGKDRYTEEKIVKVRNGSNGATSERPQVENHRESRNIKPQQPHEQKSQLAQLRSNGKELHDWKNSTVDSEINDNELHVGKEKRSSHDETNVNEELPILLNNRIDVCKIGSVGENSQDNEKMTIEIGNCPIGNKAIENHFEGPTKTKLQDSTNEKDTKTTNTVKSNETLVTNGKMSVECHSSLAKNLDTERSKITRISMEPTKILKSEYVANDKAVDPRSKNNSSINRVEGDEFFETTYGSSTTISSDDCATVVVIDEPERKIAFNEDNDNIHHQDWLEAGVRYSSTKITLAGDETIDRSNELSRLDDADDKDDDCNYEDLKNENEQQAYCDLDFARIRERIAMSSLQGLPPLPRSLSGFNLNEGRREAGEPPPPPTRSSSKTPKNIKSTQPSSSRPSPPGRQLTTLDTQLAILRKEMFGLRQLDLSLLSQLWSLNESIQEFRQLLQDQEDRAPSPSPSSEEGDDISYGSHPPPPPRRPAPLLHHHRPPRPPRPLRPPASDESPSSEEYGAV